LLLSAALCYPLLPSAAFYCSLLLLLSAGLYWTLMDSAAALCYPLLPSAALCCFLLPSAAALCWTLLDSDGLCCCSLLPSAALCCPLLLLSAALCYPLLPSAALLDSAAPLCFLSVELNNSTLIPPSLIFRHFSFIHSSNLYYPSSTLLIPPSILSHLIS
jgi:hypothetical protein